MNSIAKKICLVGDFAVGKTSLIRRFVDRQFSDQYLTTVGVKLSRKNIQVSSAGEPKQTNIELLIWDIEGQTQFKKIVPSYLQGAKGGIIVADVTRQETIEHIREHIKLFLSVNPQGLIIIALNKVDLVSEEKLKKLSLMNLFTQHSQIVSTYVTSAKTGEYVDEMFSLLAHKIVE
jgi:small GTP-binding protein